MTGNNNGYDPEPDPADDNLIAVAIGFIIVAVLLVVLLHPYF